MKELSALALIIGVFLGASYLVVERQGDRETFVPPPDAVAEAFAREVMTGRYDRAQEFLVERVPREELEALRARLGEPENVETETTSRDDEHAEVEVKVKEATFLAQLAWDRDWKIDPLPKVILR